MTMDMAQFHQVFFDESFEGLDIMETGLLDMDPGAVDDETINAIFRAAHSIKGGAGTFGFMNISNFTHVMETLLDEMRDGRRQVTQEAVTALLESVDIVREMMNAAQEGGEADEVRVDEQKKVLEDILANKAPSAASAPAAEPVQAAETTPSTETVETAAPAEMEEIKPIGWHIVFRPHSHMFRTGNDPLRIIRELEDLGEMEVICDSDDLPDLATIEPEDSYLSWDIHLKGDIEQSQVQDIFEWVEDDCDFAVIPILPEGAEEAIAAAAAAQQAAEETAAVEAAAKAEEDLVLGERRNPQTQLGPPAGVERRQAKKPAAGGGASAAAGQSSSIRVDINKIDSLINMVGELVITQSMLSMMGEDFDISDVERLQTGLAQLERHTRELQESVMQIRMLPISFSFSRFPRLVHDLSTKLGKQIELEMSGENTEVDKTVIEKIGDPLVHLVRNSLDHGIEMPEERAAAGKPETGTIELKASHKGGNIVIEIIDDGKGLDRDRIFDKAVDRGLVSEDDHLTDQQIYELIFMPGFSTADEISDVSGRGVGMDVVRRNINELGGSIEIDSRLGEGTSITIRLPLTLAILDGQTVRVADETYIVPLANIVESIQIRPDMINMVAGKGETFRLREKYLPIIRLHEVFGIENADHTDISEGLLVVVEAEGKHCGLFVDDLLGQQQVVIKSLESNYKKVDGISGATILGDGSVSLIMDIPGLIRMGKNEGHRLADVSQLTA